MKEKCHGSYARKDKERERPFVKCRSIAMDCLLKKLIWQCLIIVLTQDRRGKTKIKPWEGAFYGRQNGKDGHSFLGVWSS